jgi:hypothetical protein
VRFSYPVAQGYLEDRCLTFPPAAVGPPWYPSGTKEQSANRPGLEVEDGPPLRRGGATSRVKQAASCFCSSQVPKTPQWASVPALEAPTPGSLVALAQPYMSNPFKQLLTSQVLQEESPLGFSGLPWAGG